MSASAGREYTGLDQNYDPIYEALLEGTTVWIRIDNQWDGITEYVMVTSWGLDPYQGLILKGYNASYGYYETYFFENGSYHTATSGPK